MKKNALVIGGTGLLGYSLANNLCKAGWNVKVVSRNSSDEGISLDNNLEYIVGDINDEKILSLALKDVDKVFLFMSSTFPSSSMLSLELEINNSIRTLDILIRKMLDFGIKYLVFPSSGGTVYGNISSGLANESFSLNPITPYGMGKMFCEEIIEYYANFGLSATVLRIGNVYGSSAFRKKNQGVIDIFIQKALMNEPATIWGNSVENIRDYIFIDDFAEAVVKIANFEKEGISKYNLSSGVGTSLKDIVNIINNYVPNKLKINYIENDATSSINRIVLDINKICSTINWKPKFSIESGIKETIKRKKNNIR